MPLQAVQVTGVTIPAFAILGHPNQLGTNYRIGRLPFLGQTMVQKEASSYIMTRLVSYGTEYNIYRGNAE
jgi:hypothetical protein